MSRGLRLGCIAWVLAGLSVTAAAKLREQEQDLPVRVSDRFGKVIEQTIRLTVFVDDSTPQPRPILVLNHGRATEAEARAALGRARFVEASRWFAARGFAVALPTRVGYGVSGGEDVEDSGDCSRKHYRPTFDAAAEQVQATLAWMQTQPDTLKDRSVVMGQSFGGATSIAVAARNPEGVVAAINFAGGGGGNPKTHAQEPCSPVLLSRVLSAYGQTARVPMLWVYTENDQFFGPRYPRQWAEGFAAAGGRVEFKQFGPHGEDGHLLFSRFPAVWQPVVAEFLRRQGFTDFKD